MDLNESEAREQELIDAARRRVQGDRGDASMPPGGKPPETRAAVPRPTLPESFVGYAVIRVPDGELLHGSMPFVVEIANGAMVYATC